MEKFSIARDLHADGRLTRILTRQKLTERHDANFFEGANLWFQFAPKHEQELF